MKIVGKIVSDGAVKVFGRIEGELQGSSVVIYADAEIEGDVIAQEVTVAGRVKGAISAIRVTLQGTAVVEGDISHRSLTIAENARFEGTSRRAENPAEKPPNPQLPAQSWVGVIEGNGKIAEEEQSSQPAN